MSKPFQLTTDTIITLMKTYIEAGLAKNASKKCNASYNFILTDKKDGVVVTSFSIDLREGHEKVSKEKLEKPDATFQMVESDFHNMCLGKLNPQIAFVKRQLKITGNFKKASIFTPDLFPKPTQENIEKYMKMVKL